MGIHTYRAIEQYPVLEAKSFSYLDAKTFQIIDDEQGARTDDLRQEIELTFQELVDLHGDTEKKGSDSEFDEAIKVFTTLAEAGELTSYFDSEIKGSGIP